MPRYLALTLLASFVIVPPAHAYDRPREIVLPLVLHVPDARPDAWAETQLDGLAEAYGPAHIRFDVSFAPLPPDRRHLPTTRDRRALRSLLGEHAIEVFLVDRADDPSPAASTIRTAARLGLSLTGLLGGAHVPAAGHHPSTYVVVTRDGSRFSLAHEIGHFLGCGHSADPADIMSYAAERRRFADAELATLRSHARRALQTRELRT